jgi:hypothetical protein
MAGHRLPEQCSSALNGGSLDRLGHFLRAPGAHPVCPTAKTAASPIGSTAQARRFHPGWAGGKTPRSSADGRRPGRQPWRSCTGSHPVKSLRVKILLVLLVSLATTAVAAAARPPTPAEKSGIITAIDQELRSAVKFPAKCSPSETIKVSTLAPGYAIATPGQMKGGCAVYNGNGFFLLKARLSGWSIVWQGSELPNCGVIPDTALADLTGGCMNRGVVVTRAQLERHR